MHKITVRLPKMLNKLAIFHFLKRRPVVSVLFSLLFLFLFSSFTLALYLLKEDQKEQITQYVDSSAHKLDNMLTEDLYDYMEVNLYHYIRPFTFGRFFTDSSSDPDFLTEMRIAAVDSMRLQKNLKSLILYRTSDSTLLSTLSVRSDYTDSNPAYSHIASAMKSGSILEPHFLTNPDGDVFYYYPLFGQGSANMLGCTMVQLRSPDSYFQINVTDLNPRGTFLILSNNRIIFSEGYNILSGEVIETLLLNAPGGEIFTYNNTGIAPCLFYCIPSSIPGLQYVYYEPTRSLSSFMKGYGMFCVPLLLSAAGTSLFFTITVLQAHEHKKALDDAAKHSQVTGFPIITAGSPPAEVLFPDKPFSNYSAILIEYRALPSLKQDNETLQNAICHYCNQYLSGCQIAYHIIPHYLYIYCYVNYAEYNMRVLNDSLKQTLYNTIENCEFNLYYTNTLSSVEDMMKEIRFLQSSLCYTQVFGYGKRFPCSYLLACSQSAAVLDKDADTILYQLLNSRKYSDAVDWLNLQKQKVLQSLSSPANTCYSYNAIYYFMEGSFFCIKRFFAEKNHVHPLVSQNMTSVLHLHTGIVLFCDYLSDAIEEYRAANEQHSSAQESQFMEAVYLYIEQNLTSVTLNSMAEHFHLTTAHLSRMFKKNTEQNFSEYLSEKKLQRAILLLEQDNKISIAAISKELGYSTPAYFLTKFKERYGITPSAYRKAYLTRKGTDHE